MARSAAPRLAGLTAAVINAGVVGAERVDAMSFAEWRRIMASNLDGAFLTLRAAVVSMVLFFSFIGAWHLATRSTGSTAAMNPEYAKLMGLTATQGKSAMPGPFDVGAKLWDPSKVVVITDHYLPAYDEESRNIIRIARDWVKAEGVQRFHDGIGICHVVLPEQGHLRPGMFVVGGDSHSCTGGAFGAFVMGVGSTEMMGVVALTPCHFWK